jgi:phage repressor protein C with HTH and peptisase S24 domain
MADPTLKQIGERIREARGKMPRKQFAELCGVSQSTIQNYEGGEREPGAEILIKIYEALNVNLAWLLTGTGPKLIGSSLADGYVLINLWNVEASSGHGVLVGHEETGSKFPIPLSITRTLATSGTNLCAVFNRGSSNAPDLNDGDILIVDRGIERIVDDAYYLFQDDGALLVKMIERTLGGKVILKSRNPSYESRELPRDETERLKVFGRVRWRIGAI